MGKIMKKFVLTVLCTVLMSPVVPLHFAMAQDATAAAAPTGQHQRGHDGKGMTKAQFMAKAQERAEKMFARMDKNGDGVVTREEMKAARAEMKGERGERGERGDRPGQDGVPNGGHEAGAGGNVFP
jgi:hypothetical protein